MVFSPEVVRAVAVPLLLYQSHTLYSVQGDRFPFHSAKQTGIMLNRWTTLTIKVFGIAGLAALLLTVGLMPASSRIWKPTPNRLAADYAVINDSRPSGELIFLMWFAAPMVRPDMPNAEQLRALLAKYIFLSVVHSRLDKTTGTFSFENVDAIEARNASGKPLIPVTRTGMSPTTAGAVTIIEKMFSQTLGSMGKGMKMFVFEPGEVDACKKGELTVPFADETYTWETPFPGCS